MRALSSKCDELLELQLSLSQKGRAGSLTCCNRAGSENDCGFVEVHGGP